MTKRLGICAGTAQSFIVGLKLFGATDWAWIWILAPTWSAIIITALVTLVIFRKIKQMEKAD